MIHPNGHDRGSAIVQGPKINETMPGAAVPSATTVQPVEVATRAKQRAKQQLRQNRFVILSAGAIVVALMIFVVTSMPRRTAIQKPKNGVVTANDTAPGSAPAPPDKSIFPIIDSGRPQAKETHQGFLNEQDLDKTAMRQHSAYGAHAGPPNAPGTWERFRLSAENSKHGRRRRTSPEQSRTECRRARFWESRAGCDGEIFARVRAKCI